MPVHGPQYPVNLILAGKRCLVVGGGRVAARKVHGLLAAGALVHVIAPEICKEVEETEATFERRVFERGDVDGFSLVVTATGDPLVNRLVHDEAELHGLWVNAADDPDSCSFTLPAVVRRGDLMVTVSTGGHSPALSTWLKRRIEAEVGPDLEGLLGVLSKVRDEVKRSGRSTEDLDWQRALDGGVVELAKSGNLVEADQELRRQLLGGGES